MCIGDKVYVIFYFKAVGTTATTRVEEKLLIDKIEDKGILIVRDLEEPYKEYKVSYKDVFSSFERAWRMVDHRVRKNMRFPN